MILAPETHSITAEQDANLLVEKDQLIKTQSDIITKKSNIISAQKKRIEVLEKYLRLERARLYGRSSEKNPDQGEIFDETEMLSCDSDEGEIIDNATVAKKPKGKGGRKGLSKSLPRHQVHIDLSDEDKDGAIDTFYTVVKEELDIEPAKARVIEYLQEKAVFVDGDKRSIKSATLPKHTLGKCIASASLLAFVIVSKYCDGLPLYRLENILKRYGGEITRTSLANWVIRQWSKLIAYCGDGRLNISNVLAENAIRPFFIGRKAWLFADTPKGVTANWYSLVETAKANGLEP